MGIVGGGLGWISGCGWWLRFRVCGWIGALLVTSGLRGWVCGWIDTSCVQFSEMRLLRWFDGGCRFGFIWCGLCIWQFPRFFVLVWVGIIYILGGFLRWVGGVCGACVACA